MLASTAAGLLSYLALIEVMLPTGGIIKHWLCAFIYHSVCYFSSKTAVARMFNVSQGQPIGSIRLGETGSGVRDVAWLNPQVRDVT